VTITVTGSKSAGYVTVYPDGTGRPGQAAVEFGAGQQASDLALATVGKMLDSLGLAELKPRVIASTIPFRVS